MNVSKTSQGWVGPSSALAEDEGNLSIVCLRRMGRGRKCDQKVNNLTWLENQIQFKNWWKLKIKMEQIEANEIV